MPNFDISTEYNLAERRNDILYSARKHQLVTNVESYSCASQLCRKYNFAGREMGTLIPAFLNRNIARGVFSGPRISHRDTSRVRFWRLTRVSARSNATGTTAACVHARARVHTYARAADRSRLHARKAVTLTCLTAASSLRRQRSANDRRQIPQPRGSA